MILFTNAFKGIQLIKVAEFVRYLTKRTQITLLIDRCYYLTSDEIRRSPSRPGYGH